jgi:antitoxin VapB
MAFHVRDPETDRIVRELAAVRSASLTDTIKEACRQALDETRKDSERERLDARMTAVRERLARLPKDESVVIDKAFFDALNDE